MLLGFLWTRRCSAVATLCSTTGGVPVRCDLDRHVQDPVHEADRGMDLIRWTEELA